MTKHRRKKNFLQRHSLSIVSILLLATWIIAYGKANPDTHLGSFFGNAIADWSGSVMIILGTKFFFEIGSAESRPFHTKVKNRFLDLLWEHSLLIVIGLTGLGWMLLYAHMKADSKWGQVVGNLVSEWGQMAGLVFLTKRLAESGSKESRGR